ncbi:MAG: DUF2628 domain-containing protein [Proteobacteria bacterium]|nr:DUF2628 domain-containing protein [Pseudomonadota bacterium]
MKMYTVHLRRHGLDPDRDVVLVKEGFSWPAFFLTFVWALWHRLWLAAVLIIAANIIVSFCIHFLRPDPLTQAVVALGVAAIVGYLANDYRQEKLAEQGFAFDGVVSGLNKDHALRRYLDMEPALAADFKP